jgi:DNA polymerase III epsilon subunit-like protein
MLEVENVIVFDTETTGLSASDKVVELAYLIGDTSGKVLAERRFVIDCGIPILNTSFHGITTEMATREGVLLQTAYDSMMEDVRKHGVNLRVAHNVSFDDRVLSKEVSNYDFGAIETFCTMEVGQYALNVLKWPKLVELHRFFFYNEDYIPHRALNDVRATYKCFVRLALRLNEACITALKVKQILSFRSMAKRGNCDAFVRKYNNIIFPAKTPEADVVDNGESDDDDF